MLKSQHGSKFVNVPTKRRMSITNIELADNNRLFFIQLTTIPIPIHNKIPLLDTLYSLYTCVLTDPVLLLIHLLLVHNKNLIIP